MGSYEERAEKLKSNLLNKAKESYTASGFEKIKTAIAVLEKLRSHHHDFIDQLEDLPEESGFGSVMEPLEHNTAEVDSRDDQENSPPLDFKPRGKVKFFRTLLISTYLMEINADVYTVVASILQDSALYPQQYITEIKSLPYGAKALLISKKLMKIKEIYRNIKDIQNNKKTCDFFISIAKDTRTILISLAYAVYQAKYRIDSLNDTERDKFIKTVQYVYAPLAERIGIYRVQNELENLIFKKNNPSLYHSINERLSFLRRETKIDIHNFIDDLEALLSEQRIDFRIEGREKTVFSIWKKMERKQIPFERLFDIFAFRIITKSEMDCYIALAKIHMRYRSKSDGFCDYISNPKNNSYQSLHTIIYDGKNRTLEIQIRTEKMHEIAEFGLAAHWKYKHDWAFKEEMIEKIKSRPSEIVDDSYAQGYKYNEYIGGQIFCFTPRGEIVSLPEGATALDFAFAIHTDLGATAMHAKINNKVARLATRLRNGDQVRIMQSLKVQANSDWLDFVHTTKASNEIRQIIKRQSRDNSIAIGRALITKNLKNHNIECSDGIFSPHLETLHCVDADDLFYKLGVGEISQDKILNLFSGKKSKSSDARGKNPLLLLKNLLRKTRLNKVSPDGSIEGLGIVNDSEQMESGIQIRLSRCCYPLPGEDIVGLLIPGKRLEVHSIECEALKNLDNTSNIFEMSWVSGAMQNMSYLCRISLVVSNEIGSLASILFMVAQFQVNLENVIITKYMRDTAEIFIDIETKGIDQAKRLISSIAGMSNVYKCTKYRSDRLLDS